jgi:hypothetical protein
MRKLIFGVAVVAASMTAMPRNAVAQGAMPVSFGILGGATMPLGSWGDFYDTGWHAGALLGFTPASLPIGIRVEGVYHYMGGKDNYATGGNWSMINANVNGVFNIAMTGSPIQPYIIGGVGLYNWKEGASDEFDETDRQNDFGVNIGGGIRFMLSGLNAFVEARWHNIMVENDAAHMLPISVGITIR